MDFWSTPLGWTLITAGGILLVTVGILISLAFLLLADRKIWAGVQMRKGPNVVGPFGLLAFDGLLPALPLGRRHGFGLVDRDGAGGQGHRHGEDQQPVHAPTPNTRQAATTTTATSEVGRKIFQPSRISWS